MPYHGLAKIVHRIHVEAGDRVTHVPRTQTRSKRIWVHGVRGCFELSWGEKSSAEQLGRGNNENSV
jgi:hypothetical protein